MQAAESLAIKSTTIDAHIGYIQHSPTAQMIVANSFKLNCKMDPPIHRLDLPDLADKSKFRLAPCNRDCLFFQNKSNRVKVLNVAITETIF